MVDLFTGVNTTRGSVHQKGMSPPALAELWLFQKSWSDVL